MKLNLVVLIDDSPADNYLHKMTIERAELASDIVVYEAADRALPDILSESVKPDLIFLDVNMPRVTGLDFLDELRAQAPSHKGPVIMMLTTSLNPADRERAEAAGVAGFITKPLDDAQLQEIIERHFPNRDGDT